MRKRLASSLALVIALSASAAMADPAPVPDSEYECVLEGAASSGGNPGFFSVERDSQTDDGESDLVPNVGLMPDEDEGSFGGVLAGECTHIDSDLDAPPTTVWVQAYHGDFFFRYENAVCTTGRLRGSVVLFRSGPPTSTVPQGGAASPEDGLGFDYDAPIVAGNGPLDITRAQNGGGETGDGDGIVTIVPRDTDSNPATVACVDRNVQVVDVRFAFTLHLDHEPF